MAIVVLKTFLNAMWIGSFEHVQMYIGDRRYEIGDLQFSFAPLRRFVDCLC